MNKLKLKAKVAEKGLTQAEAAKKVGMSAAAFNNKLLGKTAFTLPEVERLCDVLEISDVAEKVDIFLT